MSSDFETAASETASIADQRLDYDISFKRETVTLDTTSNSDESAIQTSIEEYDIISHSESANSYSDETSTKESTPTKESKETSDEVKPLTSTPMLVKRMFTSSSQRLNESLTEVNVTLDPISPMIKKLSGSTASIDSNDSTTTVTKETVIPTMTITDEDQQLDESTSTALTME